MRNVENSRSFMLCYCARWCASSPEAELGIVMVDHSEYDLIDN